MSRPRHMPSARSRALAGGYGQHAKAQFESRPCAVCGAAAGQHCTTASGNATNPHAQRVWSLMGVCNSEGVEDAKNPGLDRPAVTKAPETATKSLSELRLILLDVYMGVPHGVLGVRLVDRIEQALGVGEVRVEPLSGLSAPELCAMLLRDPRATA